MYRTNRGWLPTYCNPDAYLPRIQETATLFSRPPFLFSDFVGRTLRFLQSDRAKSMGFEYDRANTLPCKWKCADESLFGVDLSIYAFTGHYPFDKGLIGGRVNEGSIAAAVHHGRINIDFGGSHVGYLPGSGGGRFGHIWRPLCRERSTDCGHMMALLAPFQAVYDDACQNILVFRPEGHRVMLSVPNEFVQPSWCRDRIKLLIDTDTLVTGTVPYDPGAAYTHTPIGRTLFYLRPDLLDGLPEERVTEYTTPEPTPIGDNLTHLLFNIYDSESRLDEHGLPEQKILLYMKYILAARSGPPPLKAAVVNTSLEYNRLTDTVRAAQYAPYCFASLTGVFIDLYDDDLGRYTNLFQPLGLSIKPANAQSMVEMEPVEIHELFDKLRPVDPVRPVLDIIGGGSAMGSRDKFTFRPGFFER